MKCLKLIFRSPAFQSKISSLHAGLSFVLLLSSADFFKINFSNNSFRNALRVPNRSNPDQVRILVKLFAKNMSR